MHRLFGSEKQHPQNQSQRCRIATPPVAHDPATEQEQERPPGHRGQEGDEIRQREDRASETERGRSEEGGWCRQLQRSQKEEHPRRGQGNVQDDLQMESERESSQNDEPCAGIERLEAGIGRQRLAGGEEAIPEGKLTAPQDVLKDGAGRKVVANHVANVEALAGEQNAGEQQQRHRDQQREPLPITGSHRARA